MPRVTPNSKSAAKKSRAKKKPKRPTAEQLERRRRQYRFALQACLAAVVLGSLVVSYAALASHVRTQITVPDEPPRVVLSDRPAWMSDRIANDVATVLADVVGPRPSQLNPAPLAKAHALLSANPWVREVRQVRRLRDEATGRDTLVIDCEWRTPVAIVRYGDAAHPGDYRLIADAEPEGNDGAILLPLRYTGDEIRAITQAPTASRTNLRVIDGVTMPPPEPGSLWLGAAVRAGVDMATLLHNDPGAADVTIIDVSGVSDPTQPNTRANDYSPIVLRTRFGTEIYWGRPPRSNDFLVEPRIDVKLSGLRVVREEFAHTGRYPTWVDLRYEPPRASKD